MNFDLKYSCNEPDLTFLFRFILYGIHNFRDCKFFDYRKIPQSINHLLLYTQKEKLSVFLLLSPIY